MIRHRRMTNDGWARTDMEIEEPQQRPGAHARRRELVDPARRSVVLSQRRHLDDLSGLGHQGRVTPIDQCLQRVPESIDAPLVVVDVHHLGDDP